MYVIIHQLSRVHIRGLDMGEGSKFYKKKHLKYSVIILKLQEMENEDGDSNCLNMQGLYICFYFYIWNIIWWHLTDLENLDDHILIRLIIKKRRNFLLWIISRNKEPRGCLSTHFYFNCLKINTNCIWLACYNHIYLILEK